MLTRPLGATIATPRGGMVPVNAALCAGLPANTATTVLVPKLTWGASAVNNASANQRFDVQLIDGTTGRVLDTLTLARAHSTSAAMWNVAAQVTLGLLAVRLGIFIGVRS